MNERAKAAVRGAVLRLGLIWLVFAPAGFAVSPAGAQTVDVSLEEQPAANRDVLLQALIQSPVAGPVQLRILRMTLEPGARSPWHAHPGLEFGVVERGTLRVQVDGEAVVRPADAAPDTESQALPENLDISLSTGDRIAYAPGTLMTFENPGTEPTTLLAATVFPVDVAPATYPAGEPTAADLAGIESMVLGQATVPSVGANSVVVFERLAVAAGESVPEFSGPVLMSLEAGAVAGTVQAAAVSAPGDSTVTEGDEVDFNLNSGQAAFFSNGMSQAPLGGGGSIELLRLGLLPGVAPEGRGTPEVTVTSVAADPVATAAEPGDTTAPSSVATIGPAPATEAPAEATAVPSETPEANPAPTQRPLRTITGGQTPTPEPAADSSTVATTDQPAADGAGPDTPDEATTSGAETVDAADAALYPAPGTLLVVNDTDVRIRAEPSTSGEILAGLTTGQVVLVLDLPTAADDIIWYPVQVADDPNLAGWVAAQFLNVAAP